MAEQDFKNFMVNAEEIVDGLKDGADFVNAVYIQNVQEQVRRIKEHADDIMNKNRDLKIGIVGQVKAGKSTFLNALLFDGEDVLPKAATPMTAALTKVSYSGNPTAKVVFYSKEDWKTVRIAAGKFNEEFSRLKRKWEQQQQEKYIQLHPNSKELSRQELEQSFTSRVERELSNKILPQFRACKELVDMADNGIFEKLDTEENIPIKNLQGSLAEYVGARGRYTPIVKYIEMGIANDALKGIQIVDTPGLGDPILSRSQKTKEFLMACDVVFLLSPTSQFMSRDDVELMMTTLPEDSINHVVLVGSKFDSALLDDSGRGRQNLSAVMNRTWSQLDNQAKSVLADCCQSEKGYVSRQILKRIEEDIQQQIKEDQTLYYISSLLYNAARHIENGKPVGRDAEKILREMEERFEGMERNPSFLRELADIQRLKDREFEKIAKKKEAIIAERSGKLLKDQAALLGKQLNAIQIEAEQNLQVIRSEDMDDLRRKMQTSQEALSSMRREIQNAFEWCATDARKHLVNLASAIKVRAKDFTDVKVYEDKNIINHGEEGMLWWKKPAWKEIITYKVANVDDVISNIHSYINIAEEELIHNLDKSIDIGATKNTIKEIVLKAFHKADANFDENDIIGPVDTMLAKLTIPPFNVVDAKKYQAMILQQFTSARVIKEEIAKMETQQTLVLRQIADDISHELESKAGEIKRVLDEQGIHFVDDVKGQIDAKIKLLEHNLQNKEESIEKYRKFIDRIVGFKEKMRIAD